MYSVYVEQIRITSPPHPIKKNNKLGLIFLKLAADVLCHLSSIVLGPSHDVPIKNGQHTTTDMHNGSFKE